MTMLFSNSRHKIPKKRHKFDPKFKDLNFFHQTLHQDKFRGADFKCDYYFQILAQKYANKTFLVPNLRIFILIPKFAIRQNRGS